jgi:hypothetical protein
VNSETFELDYGTHEISRTIQWRDDAAFVIHLEPGDQLVVDLQEENGILVDFYLTNLTAYIAYQATINDQFKIPYLYNLGGYSKNNATTIGYERTSFIKNTLVVLVDNTNFVGADSVGPVSIEGSISVHRNVWTLENILITSLVIGIIVAFMVGVKLPKKER